MYIDSENEVTAVEGKITGLGCLAWCLMLIASGTQSQVKSRN